MVKANEKPSISSCTTDDTLLGTFTFQDKISGPVSYLREKLSVSYCGGWRVVEDADRWFSEG